MNTDMNCEKKMFSLFRRWNRSLVDTAPLKLARLSYWMATTLSH